MEVLPIKFPRDELESDRIKWNQMESNGIKWNLMKSNEIFSPRVCPRGYLESHMVQQRRTPSGLRNSIFKINLCYTINLNGEFHRPEGVLSPSGVEPWSRITQCRWTVDR